MLASIVAVPAPSALMSMQRSRLVGSGALRRCVGGDGASEDDPTLDAATNPTRLEIGAGALASFRGAVAGNALIWAGFGLVVAVHTLAIAVRKFVSRPRRTRPSHALAARLAVAARDVAFPGWPVNAVLVLAPSVVFAATAVLVHGAGGGGGSGTSVGGDIALVVFLVLLPVAVAVYLAACVANELRTKGVLVAAPARFTGPGVIAAAGRIAGIFLLPSRIWKSSDLADRYDPLVGGFSRPCFVVVDILVTLVSSSLAGAAAFPLPPAACLSIAVSIAALLVAHFVSMVALRFPFLSRSDAVFSGLLSAMGAAVGIISAITAAGDSISDESAGALQGALDHLNAASIAVALAMTALMMLNIVAGVGPWLHARALRLAAVARAEAVEDDDDGGGGATRGLGDITPAERPLVSRRRPTTQAASQVEGRGGGGSGGGGGNGGGDEDHDGVELIAVSTLSPRSPTLADRRQREPQRAPLRTRSAQRLHSMAAASHRLGSGGAEGAHNNNLHAEDGAIAGGTAAATRNTTWSLGAGLEIDDSSLHDDVVADGRGFAVSIFGGERDDDRRTQPRRRTAPSLRQRRVIDSSDI